MKSNREIFRWHNESEMKLTQIRSKIKDLFF